MNKSKISLNKTKIIIGIILSGLGAIIVSVISDVAGAFAIDYFNLK